MTAPGKPLDLDGMEKAVARIHWGRTRRMIDKLRRDEACDGLSDTAADELERLADAFEFTATPLIQTQRELVGALKHEIANCPVCRGEGLALPMVWLTRVSSDGTVGKSPPKAECPRCKESRAAVFKALGEQPL